MQGRFRGGMEEVEEAPRSKAATNKNGPDHSGRPNLLLFLGCFFLRRLSSFLGCVLHRLILPNIRFAISRSQCDSYIRFFEPKVKKKMHIGPESRVPKGSKRRSHPQNHFSDELFGASKRQRWAILFLPARRVRATIGPNGLARPATCCSGVSVSVRRAVQLREEAPHHRNARRPAAGPLLRNRIGQLVRPSLSWT